VSAVVVQAQDAPKRQPPPAFKSPEVAPDRRVTMRLHAPQAKAVRLVTSDFPIAGMGMPMVKNKEGVWEATVGPAPAGAYRYRFNVDGVDTNDPRNPAVSEANSTTWNLALVPGSEDFDTRDVPHGAVSIATYRSKTLDRFRRMHIYTPPGYEKGEGKFPVFYLLHGATDSDASWSTVGRAGAILDNLIAAGKAKPMIVVMPHGHTGPFEFGGRGNFEQQMKQFGDEFGADIRPYVEGRYRVLTERANRAIAGLSMGGAQTLNIAFANLQDFGYVGVYSSGIFGIAGGFGGGAPNTQWEESHLKSLDDPEAKKGLKLLWFGCGKDDFLFQTSNATVEMLKKHKFDVVNRETDGGHTWLKWRDYLVEFAPQLFK
jgi:enterochelin esterase family protein